MATRKNLSGSMAFRSYIPPKISEYEIITEGLDLEGLHLLFGKLSRELHAADEDAVSSIIKREAYASYDLAADHASNPFSFFAVENENAENIIRATRYGVEALEEFPISSRLMRNLHYIICEGADYDKKYRGDFRKSPVWIGRPGAGIHDADYVAPVGEDLTEGMTDLENYINYSEHDPFVKAAVIHYQFEMLHPFIDANGRVGRLLNNLFLLESGNLPNAALLLSPVISRNYNRYCNEIQKLNATHDMTSWLKYFLELLREAAIITLKQDGTPVTYTELGCRKQESDSDGDHCSDFDDETVQLGLDSCGD